MRKTIIPALFLFTLVNASFARAGSVTFFTDRALFESALSSKTTINFEGIVNDNEILSPFSTTLVFSGVSFTASFSEPTSSTPWLSVSGKNGPIRSFNSALLFHDGAGPITANLTTAGTGFTAVGGFFGDIIGTERNTTITLMGTLGILDTRTLIAGDMGLGRPPSFFGWTVEGDTIVSIQHNAVSVEGIDDFIFGVAGTPVHAVPEPASFYLFGIGTASIAGYGWRRHKLIVPR